MARKPRLDVPDWFYHVLARAIVRLCGEPDSQ